MNFAYLQVVRICDQKCIFCAQPSNGIIESYENLCKEIDKYVSLDFGGIIFTGGEPTLHKDLYRLIFYAKKKGLYIKIITNGIKLSNKEYLNNLIQSGLQTIHLSFHSYIEKIEDNLMRNKGVYRKQIEAINNINNIRQVEFTINIAINNYNVLHLDKTILFLLKNFKNIDSFILNMLEVSGIIEGYLHKLLFNLDKLKIPLTKSLEYIYKYNKKVRVSRVPMCYMKGFEESSRDSEYFIGNSKKYIDYLSDNQGGDLISDSNNWRNEKDYLEECNKCNLKSICSGYDLNGFFKKSEVKLFPYIENSDYINNIKRKYFNLNRKK